MQLRNWFAILASFAALAVVASGCGASTAAGPTVNADPKTLVLQPGDYPSNWDSGVDYPPPTGGPTDGLGTPVKNRTKPVDAYYYFIPFQNLTSEVALFTSTDEARAIFGSITVPASGRTLSFGGSTGRGFTVGEQQRVFSWDPSSSSHEVDLYWQYENVVALISTFASTNKNYPTTSDLAAEFDPIELLLMEPLAPRMQTHIRLASHSS